MKIAYSTGNGMPISAIPDFKIEKIHTDCRIE